MARKKSLAAPLFLLMGAPATTLFSVPVAAAVLPNVPSVSSPYTIKFATPVPDGGISGDVFVLLSSLPQCTSGQAAELFIVLMAGWALLALIPCAYTTTAAALARQTAVASSVTSVTVNASILACTLPTVFIVLSRYGADTFAVALPVPVLFVTALVGAGADSRERIKTV